MLSSDGTRRFQAYLDILAGLLKQTKAAMAAEARHPARPSQDPVRMALT
jgi:hypothetical protein